MCETNSFARMESLCLFNFGLRSRIRNMFLIRDLKPKLNKQSDSIRAKLFVSCFLFGTLNQN